jgi:hypothetical protein
MQNKIDYIYENSDLNAFHIRVKILTGQYEDVILEFGGSYLVQTEQGNTFTFEHILYSLPEDLSGIDINNDDSFKEYLSQLLISIIQDKKENDPPQDPYIMPNGLNLNCSIKINQRFYPTAVQ